MPSYGNIMYDGEWKNSVAHGFGKMYNGDGTLAYEGQWIDGVPEKGFVLYDEYNNPVRDFENGIEQQKNQCL